MRLEIDIPEHHYNNIMAVDSVSFGRVPYKGIIMYAINAIKHGKVLEQEAFPKAEYENRLKSDMVAMLKEIQLEIEEIEKFTNTIGWELRAKTPEEIKKECSEIIQQKINALKSKSEVEK